MVRYIFLLSLVFTNSAFAEEFIVTAKKEANTIYHQIQTHPFNQQLMQGSLKKVIYNEYLSQDGYYLQHYRNAYRTLLNKASSKDEALIYQQEIHAIGAENTNFLEKNTHHLTRANFMYSNYLDAISEKAQPGIVLAALLPCAVIYRDLAKWMLPQTQKDNPYYAWIHYYAKADYSNLNHIIELANQYYAKGNTTTRKRMLKAYQTASKLEYYFWDDVYHERFF